jgi:hypothetical protein
MRRAAHFALSVLLLLGVTLFVAAQAQQPAQPQQPDDIPATDGGSGPCSVELTVTGADAKPVYAARIDVHMEYGFGGFHKLDMGVYTNAQGKAKFTGIPAKVRKPPIEFHAKKDDLIGLATMDPAAECQAKHDIVLAKQK